MNYSFYFDQTKNRCTCKIKFSGRKLNNSNYNSGCTAVLDTGAYMSSMSVNSMVMLTGKSCEEIIGENKDEIYDNICKTASGQGLKGTPYFLENLIINGFYFKRLNF